MTVAELRLLLEAFPAELEVAIREHGSRFVDVVEGAGIVDVAAASGAMLDESHPDAKTIERKRVVVLGF